MRTVETNVAIHQKCSNPKVFMLWHDHLGHPRLIMMRWIIENSHRHPLKNQNILLFSDYPCSACSQGKLITKLSHSKIIVEYPSFLERIKVIYVDQYTHLVVYSSILWFKLMRQPDSHMYVYFYLVIIHVVHVLKVN